MKQVASYQGAAVYEYTIENDFLKVNVLNFGGTISGIWLKEDHTAMVAAFKNKQDYIEQGGPYLNALVGPIAGRIAYGHCKIEDQEWQLSINNGAHHLHGGASGISKQLFTITQLSGTELALHLETSHELDGYPKGIYVYDVRYQLKDHTLLIQYHCTPPALSLVNMTNHLYFNLSGMEESIAHHMLLLPATKKCKIEKEGEPSCVYEISKDSAFDFTTLRDIQTNREKGDPEFANTLHYDTPFLLDKDTITLYDPKTDHQVSITTDQSSVVVYTANYFDEALLFENGRKGYPLCAIALETQDIPNGINMEGVSTHQVFDSAHPYHQTTSYTFTKKQGA